MQIDVECVGFAPDFIRPIPQQLEIQSDEEISDFLKVHGAQHSLLS